MQDHDFTRSVVLGVSQAHSNSGLDALKRRVGL